jgi:hypothetical protein
MATRRGTYDNIKPGHPVDLIAGNYRGETGIFVKWPAISNFPLVPKKSAYIRLDGYDDDIPVLVRIDSVRFKRLNTVGNNPPIIDVVIDHNDPIATAVQAQDDTTIRLIAESFQSLTLELRDTRTRLERIERFLNDSVANSAITIVQDVGPLAIAIVDSHDEL